MGYGDDRTDVRHPAPFSAGKQPNGQNASSLQVIACSVVAGALVLTISQALESSSLVKYDAARIFILAAIAVVIGGIAGVFCDPIIHSWRFRRGRRR